MSPLSEDASLMQEIGELRAEVSGLRAEIGGLRELLNQAVVTQSRDHGKRIRELEQKFSGLEAALAEEKGRRAGSKAMLAAILSAASAISAGLGALASRFF